MVFNSAFYGLLTCKIWFLGVTVMAAISREKRWGFGWKTFEHQGRVVKHTEKHGSCFCFFCERFAPQRENSSIVATIGFFFSRANVFFLIWMTLMMCKKSAKRSTVHLLFVFLPIFSICMNKVRIYISSLKTPFLWGERWRGKDDHWWIEAVQIPRHFSGCYHNLKTDRTSKWIDQCR